MLNIETRKVIDLLPYALNNRKHPHAQIAALASTIREVGFRNPIHIEPSGVIIAGHGRLLAAQKLGLTEVPVIVHADLTEREARILRIADNRIAELSEVDSDNLKAELKDLLESSPESVDLTGYSQKDIDDLLAIGESISPSVKDVTTELCDEFWVSIRGPMVAQTRTLELLRESLSGVDGIEIEVGTTGKGA